ncbi:MAG: hypothetical protein AAGA91_13200 [Pseudomonadota bacterium]
MLPPLWLFGNALIALLYQASVLLVPTLAPVAVCLWHNRNSPLLRGPVGHAAADV